MELPWRQWQEGGQQLAHWQVLAHPHRLLWHLGVQVMIVRKMNVPPLAGP